MCVVGNVERIGPIFEFLPIPAVTRAGSKGKELLTGCESRPRS